MAQTTRRFLIPAYGADRGAIEKAIGLTQALCQQASSPRKVLLVVPTKRQMDGTYLSDVLGAGATKALLQGQSVRIADSSSLIFATMQTLKSYEHYDIVLSVYGSAKTLKQVDGVLGVEAVIVVPWTLNDTDEWQRVWNPQIIQNQLPEGIVTPAKSGPAHDTLSPVVIEGLKLLTGLVNLSTGLSHPMDKPKAVALFRALKKSGETFDSVAVKSWALHNQWTARGAEQLTDVAQAILDGKRIQAPNAPKWGREFIKTLRDRAKSSKSDK